MYGEAGRFTSRGAQPAPGGRLGAWRPHKHFAEPARDSHAATYGGDLAIASLNRHHDHFGTAFAITRDGAPAYSACLAFGLERWLFAITHRYGTDPRSWPDPEEAAQKVRAHQ